MLNYLTEKALLKIILLDNYNTVYSEIAYMSPRLINLSVKELVFRKNGEQTQRTFKKIQYRQDRDRIIP